MIYAVIAVQAVLAVVDHFPWSLCLLSIVSHVIYAQNLRRFPVVKLTDPIFITSCGMWAFIRVQWWNIALEIARLVITWIYLLGQED